MDGMSIESTLMKTYYKVTPGPTFKVIDAHMEKLREANRARSALRDRHGLPIIAIHGTSVSFASTYTPDKSVWRNAKKGAFTPRATSKVGALILQDLKALPEYPTWMELILSMIGDRSLDVMQVNTRGTIGVIKKKDEDFYRISTDTYWLPDDKTGLIEILASEYASANEQG